MRASDTSASASEHGSTEISYGNQDFSGPPVEAHIVDRSEIRADVEAELRDIIGPVVPAETMQFKSMQDDHQPSIKDYKLLILACMGLLVVIAAVVGLVLGLRDDPEPDIIQVFTPSSPKCETANTLIAPNVSSIAVRGSTVNATESAQCGEENFAVWYSIVGTGNAFRLTSCSDYTNFPTQLVVSRSCSGFSHSCWPSLKDNDCKSNQNAARFDWQTEEGVLYDIAIGGRTADSHGNYELVLTESRDEVASEPPTPTTPAPTPELPQTPGPTTLPPTTLQPMTDSPVTLPPVDGLQDVYLDIPGSNECSGPLLDTQAPSRVHISDSNFNASNPATCGESSNFRFYSLTGNGNTFRVTTCSEKTDFPTQISVTTDCSEYSFDCWSAKTDASCSNNPYAAATEWISEVGTRYDIAIGGRSMDSKGNFEMLLSELVVPENAYCNTPTLLSPPQGSTVSIIDSSINAVESAKCGDTNTAVWYSIVGTGHMFHLSTCSEVTDFPTQISVTTECSEFIFDCQSELQDLDCPSNTNAASTSWVTEAGVTYEIAIGGRSPTSQGNFELHLTEEASVQV